MVRTFPGVDLPGAIVEELPLLIVAAVVADEDVVLARGGADVHRDAGDAKVGADRSRGDVLQTACRWVDPVDANGVGRAIASHDDVVGTPPSGKLYRRSTLFGALSA